ncbi:hypothetical protein QOT17_008590 [Balamuthia mandrillaris]
MLRVGTWPAAGNDGVGGYIAVGPCSEQLASSVCGRHQQQEMKGLHSNDPQRVLEQVTEFCSEAIHLSKAFQQEQRALGTSSKMNLKHVLQRKEELKRMNLIAEQVYVLLRLLREENKGYTSLVATLYNTTHNNNGNANHEASGATFLGDPAKSCTNGCDDSDCDAEGGGAGASCGHKTASSAPVTPRDSRTLTKSRSYPSSPPSLEANSKPRPPRRRLGSKLFSCGSTTSAAHILTALSQTPTTASTHRNNSVDGGRPRRTISLPPRKRRKSLPAASHSAPVSTATRQHLGVDRSKTSIYKASYT